MTTLNKKFDFIILGSGLGGLQTAYVLSKKGYKVCVLEKNAKIGGTLQSFTRFGCDFSTGMHYIGSLDEGQMLNRLFKYFKLFDDIEYIRLDKNSFEKINIAGKIYDYPIGWDKFGKQFAQYFPNDIEVFERYHSYIMDVVNAQSLYSLKQPEQNKSDVTDYFNASAYEVIKSLTSNKDIQNYFAALNFDYAGEKDKTPFYVHALITNYFINSSYRVVGDTDQLADSLANSIKENDGVILKRQKVVKLIFKDKKIIAAETHTGGIYEADNFISNIHPANTMDLIDEGNIKNIYRKRMKGLTNTISSFAVHIKLKEGGIKYQNYNHQYFKQNDVWYASNYDEKTWPEHFFFQTPPETKQDKFSSCVQILTYMKYDEVKKWENSTKRNRDPEYHIWKDKKANKLIDLVNEHYPGLKGNIEDYNVSTPLSFRDYIGNSDGSMYGRISDINNNVSNYISHKTKVSNLFLTGQNLNLHGMLGVSMSSLVTLSEFTDLFELLKEINNAN